MEENKESILEEIKGHMETMASVTIDLKNLYDAVIEARNQIPFLEALRGEIIRLANKLEEK